MPKKILFILLLALFFCYPYSVETKIINDKIITTEISPGITKVSFQSDCTNYTTIVPNGKPGAQNYQNIYFKTAETGLRNPIWFQHGDGSCSFPNGRLKCEDYGGYFNSKTVLNNPKAKNLILLCPEMNPSGGKGCDPLWSEHYADSTVFPCLYNDFLSASKLASAPFTKEIVFASHSQGGPATFHITQAPPSNIKIVGLIHFDSCYSGKCETEAQMDVSKRGPMLTYASTIPDYSCPEVKNKTTGLMEKPWCNSTKNQNATKNLKIWEKGKEIRSYILPNTDHGGVPSKCKTDFLNMDGCDGEADLLGGTITQGFFGGGGATGAVEAPSSGGGAGGSSLMSEIKVILQKPSLKISIPGLKFSEPTEITENGERYVLIPFIGEYMKAIYRYGVAIASIFAVVMMINAGFSIAMSGGNSEKITHAKKRIFEALTGLILAVGSYVLLYTINPNLVEFKSLKIPYVVGFLSSGASLESSADAGADGTMPVADSTVVKTLTNTSEVVEEMFEKENIDGVSSDGWTNWNALNEAEKTQVLPYLYLRQGDCTSIAPSIKKTGIKYSNFTGKQVNQAIIPALQQVGILAVKYGFKITISSDFRTIAKQASLWNTGVVTRFKNPKYKDSGKWKTNDGLIAAPGCLAPHATGGAVDVHMYTLDGKTDLAGSSEETKKILSNSADRNANYKPYFDETPPYSLILEEIFRQAGFVRFCKESWHFENAVTVRYQKFDKQPDTRCVWAYDNWKVEIPANVKQAANEAIPTKVNIFN